MERKSCPTCLDTKPLTEFYNNRATKDGKTVYCKPCDKARTKRWQTENRQTYTQARRNSHLKTLYGLAPGEFEEFLVKQDHRCAICKTTEPGHKGVFAVDHCHWTNRVRGLLCCNCNRGIGWLKDDPTLVRRAAEYLEIRN